MLKKFEKLRYVVLRKGKDLDISVHKDDWEKVDTILRYEGFVKHPQNFNKNHVGYRKGSLGIDIRHLDDWNGIYYLDEGVYDYRLKIEGVYWPHPNYLLAHYIAHCVLGKRSWKYKKEIKELMDVANLNLVKQQLWEALSKNTSNNLVNAAKNESYPVFLLAACLESIINHPIVFTKTLFRWFHWKLKPLPLIALVGPDGSGKSETSELLVKKLKHHDYPAERVYMGRGRSNLLPVGKIGSKVKSRSWLAYWAYSALSFLDLFIRYWFQVFPKRYKKIIVTDRSYLDLLLMKRVPMLLKKTYLLFFPRPNHTFYLYHDIEILYKRRGHKKKDLNRQISILNKMEVTSKIKTTNKKKTIQKMIGELF